MAAECGTCGEMVKHSPNCPTIGRRRVMNPLEQLQKMVESTGDVTLRTTDDGRIQALWAFTNVEREVTGSAVTDTIAAAYEVWAEDDKTLNG